MQPNKTNQPAGERARDEKRDGAGPQYGGEAWKVADERAPDERFGHARNDDAEPSELVKAGQGQNDDDDSTVAADPELADAEQNAEIESGGEQAGMGRGEKPRKSKQRTK